ncbi:hypothetical protein Tco_1068516 [Tanacetum coccineum]|uniref:Uncharacterized protein n=1 Tax=Tanacetum coccineum TaxID=301880 RepID=A0ABQ5HG27_9ASTR
MKDGTSWSFQCNATGGRAAILALGIWFSGNVARLGRARYSIVNGCYALYDDAYLKRKLDLRFSYRDATCIFQTTRTKLGSAIYSYHKDKTHSISKKSPTGPSPPSSSVDSSLIDLNLYPHPIDNPKPIITPKIEPKSEPIDDMSHTPNPPIANVVPHDDVADNNNVLSE